jgi:hypothetical protein
MEDWEGCGVITLRSRWLPPFLSSPSSIPRQWANGCPCFTPSNFVHTKTPWVLSFHLQRHLARQNSPSYYLFWCPYVGVTTLRVAGAVLWGHWPLWRVPRQKRRWQCSRNQQGSSDVLAPSFTKECRTSLHVIPSYTGQFSRVGPRGGTHFCLNSLLAPVQSEAMSKWEITVHFKFLKVIMGMRVEIYSLLHQREVLGPIRKNEPINSAP